MSEEEEREVKQDEWFNMGAESCLFIFTHTHMHTHFISGELSRA